MFQMPAIMLFAVFVQCTHGCCMSALEVVVAYARVVSVTALVVSLLHSFHAPRSPKLHVIAYCSLDCLRHAFPFFPEAQLPWTAAAPEWSMEALPPSD